MTFHEFCAKVYELLPDCDIQEENTGQLVIYTNSMIKRSDTETDTVVDFVEEDCKCSDCTEADRECNCPHGLEGDHNDTCYYATRDPRQKITNSDKIIEVPEVDLTPVNDEVYRRLSSIEVRLEDIENRISTYLDDRRGHRGT